MKRAVLLAVVLGFALAGASSADLLNGTWSLSWSDNFDWNTGMNLVLGKNTTPNLGGWIHTGSPQSKTYNDGGDVVINLCSCSTGPRNARHSGPALTNQAGVDFRFNMRSVLTAASDYTWLVAGWVDNPTAPGGSTCVPMWLVSNTAVRPYVGPWLEQVSGYSGPMWTGDAIPFGDASWHVFDVVWNRTTGYAEWYMDGALRAALPTSPSGLDGYYNTRTVDGIELQQVAGGAQAGSSDGAVAGILLDDLSYYIGTPGSPAAVPEPGSLLVLGTFMAGAFGLVRRRGA